MAAAALGERTDAAGPLRMRKQGVAMDTVRIGIAGLGWWACDTHIPNLLRVPGAAVTALCSRNPENIERGRAALGDAADVAAFSDYDELLASDAADAVLVCTPNHLHGAMALAAVWAGKHALVEKPLAFDPAQCRLIADEAAQRGLAVQVGVELRYSDVAQAMRRLVAEGAIGEPALLRTDVWRQWGAPGSWRADEAQSGGLFHELAIHYFDLIGFVAGTPPQAVTASGGVKATGRDLDYTAATIGYQGGALAALSLCLFAAGGGDDVAVEVIGTESRLTGDVTAGSVRLWPRDAEPEDRSPARPDAEVFGFPGSLESVAAFVECVRTGTPPLADAAAGEQLCRVCEGARRSVAAGGELVTL